MYTMPDELLSPQDIFSSDEVDFGEEDLFSETGDETDADKEEKKKPGQADDDVSDEDDANGEYDIEEDDTDDDEWSDEGDM